MMLYEETGFCRKKNLEGDPEYFAGPDLEAAEIICRVLSITIIVSTWAFRTCCMIGFAVGIICLIMGAIQDWWQYLLLFGAAGIVWLIPYGINAMTNWRLKKYRLQGRHLFLILMRLDLAATVKGDKT